MAADRADVTYKAVDLPGGPSSVADRVDGTYKAMDLPGGPSRVVDPADVTYKAVDLVVERVVPAVFTEWGR
jgi:hypothetical protein